MFLVYLNQGSTLVPGGTDVLSLHPPPVPHSPRTWGGFLWPTAPGHFFGIGIRALILVAASFLLTQCARVEPVPPGPFGPMGRPLQGPRTVEAPAAPQQKWLGFTCKPPGRRVDWYRLALSPDQGQSEYYNAGIKPDYSIDIVLPPPPDGCYMASAMACKYAQDGSRLCANWSPWVHFEWPLPEEKRSNIVPMLYLLLLSNKEKKNASKKLDPDSSPYGPYN